MLAQAANLDTTADLFFGQPDFAHRTPNYDDVRANSLAGPTGAVLDVYGDLYVADEGNNHVLEYDAPLTSGIAATRVFGLLDFTHDTANGCACASASAGSLWDPTTVALDAQGNLYVADSFNSRVLEYDRPLPLPRNFLPLVRR